MLSSSRNPSGRLISRLICAVVALCAAAAAPGANWVFDPRVEVGAIYDDNYRLTDQPGQEIEVTGASIDAALGLRNEGQRSLFELVPRIRSTFFPSESNEEATDYFLSGLAEKRTQRLTTRFFAQAADESVVSSELLAADFPGVDLGETVSGDTGRVSLRNRRTMVVARPSMVYDWTERRHLQFEFQYTDADFDRAVVEQVGYKDYAASAGIVWDLSQRRKLLLTLLGDRYSAENSSEDTRTGGARAEWRTAASEVTTWYLRAGVARSERDASGTGAKSSSTAFNGGGGVAWQLQTTRVVFDVLRNTVPSATGVVVNRDELRFRVQQDFQPRLSGFFALRGIHTEATGDDTLAIRSRDYAAGTAGFEWRMNLRLSLRGAYDYTWQEFEDEPNDAVSNGVTLSIVYEPRRLN